MLNSVTFSDLESDKAYYIYAKCIREVGSTGVAVILDTTQRAVQPLLP